MSESATSQTTTESPDESTAGPAESTGLAASSLLLAVLLGVLALVPFAAGVYYAYTHGTIGAARTLTWLLAYLATIVSFIGGAQWGQMVSQQKAPPQDMVLAVVPALIAWPALLLTGPWPFFMLLGALLIAWMVDEHGGRAGWQRRGFLWLRRLLTLVGAGRLGAIGWRVMRG